MTSSQVRMGSPFIRFPKISFRGRGVVYESDLRESLDDENRTQN